MATNFEPNKCVIFVKSTKIGTHENKAIHSILPAMKLEGLNFRASVYWPIDLLLCLWKKD